MKEALIIKNKLIFDGTAKENSIFFRQGKFELSLFDIKVIGVKSGVFFDDDYAVVVIISNKNKKYFLSLSNLNNETMNELNSFFEIDVNNALSNYLHHEIDNHRSKILFPKKYEGERIFRKNNVFTKVYLGFGKLFLIFNYADGILTKKIKSEN